MKKVTVSNATTYPRNLLAAVFGEDHVPQELPSDIEQSLDYVLGTVSEREAKVLRMKYQEGEAIKDIASLFGVSSERVRQIIRKGERLLRHPSRSRYLRKGCAAVAKEESLRGQLLEQQTGKLEECIRSTLQPERFSGPLSEIPDAHDRVDTILARSGIDTVEDMKPSVRLCNTLRRNGIDYVWELCFAQPNEILQLKFTGARQLAEIERLLKPYDLSLDDGTLSADPQLWEYAEQRLSAVKEQLLEMKKLQWRMTV